MSILLYGCTTWTLTKRRGKSLTAITQECYEQYWTSPRGSTPQSSSCIATYNPSQKLSKLDELDMRDTTGEVGTNSEATYYNETLHMDEQRQDDHLEPIYNRSVPIQDVALTTYRCTIETGGGRGSVISVLAVRHDDVDTLSAGFIIQRLHSLLKESLIINIIIIIIKSSLH